MLSTRRTVILALIIVLAAGILWQYKITKSTSLETNNTSIDDLKISPSEPSNETEPSVDPSLWEMNPKILLNRTAPGLFWYKGVNQSVVNSSFRDTLRRLTQAYLDGDPIIVEKYGMTYVNDHNNTAFIVVTSMDKETLDYFNEVMNPDPGVTVIFRKGPASFAELDVWEQVLREEVEKIRDQGIRISFWGKSANATLVIGVVDITLDKVETIVEIIGEEIPPGILVFELGELAELV